MIKYNLGNDVKIAWKDFLSLDFYDVRMYKSEFKSFSDFFEYLDKNIKDITNLLFDGYEYKLENGVLHNLYGPALIKYIDDDNAFRKGTIDRFYINGKIVLSHQKEIRKLNDFENEEIYHYEELDVERKMLSLGRLERMKEGIHYINHYIDLKELRKRDKRNKKLNRILDR